MATGVEESIGALLQTGFLGAAVILEAAVILFLMRRIDGRDKIIENRDQIISSLQDKRVAENKENIENFLGVGKDMISGMSILKDSMASITRFIERVNWGKK